jgi:hypothetical protein
VTAGYDYKKKVLGFTLVVNGAVGTRFSPNVSAIAPDVPIELDVSLELQARAAVAINVSLTIDFTDGVTSPKGNITVNQFKVHAVSPHTCHQFIV